jgi:hypothetical protein
MDEFGYMLPIMHESSESLDDVQHAMTKWACDTCSRDYLELFVDLFWGYLLQTCRRIFRLLMHLMKDRPSPPLLNTPLVVTNLPPISRMGMDHIYVINLQRRGDRRRKMAYAMKIIGAEIGEIVASEMHTQALPVNSGRLWTGVTCPPISC